MPVSVLADLGVTEQLAKPALRKRFVYLSAATNISLMLEENK